MDWDLIAPMVVSIVFFVTVGGVILLRPLSKRLGDLLEVMAQERRELPGLEREFTRMREGLDRLEDRLQLLEERQDFTDQLLRRGEGEKKEIEAPKGARGGEG